MDWADERAQKFNAIWGVPARPSGTVLDFDRLHREIAAALREAERRGAEEMRARAACAAEAMYVSQTHSAKREAGEVIARTIRALPAAHEKSPA